MGYQPSMGSPNLTQAAANVSPEDLQQFYAMSAGAEPAAPSLTPDQVDPALLAQLMGTPAPQSQMDQVSANQLAMMGVPPPSDPNGLIPPSDTQALGPDGRSLNLPPNTGAANTYGAAPAPQQAPPPAPSQPQQPKLTEWQQYLTERGIGPNSVIDMASHRELLKGFNAVQLKRMEMNDPEKQLKLQKDRVELQKSTMEQSDAVNKKIDAVPKVQNNIKLLDDLLAHKGLSSAVGAKDGSFLWGMKKEPMAGTEAANFMARMEQVQGLNFLEAFNQLKGAGQITEIEGDKATKALGRLGTNQSESEFRNSVAELRGILQTGLDRSKARLGTQAPSAPAPTPPPGAPVIRTTSRGTFQSIGNGQWVQIK